MMQLLDDVVLVPLPQRQRLVQQLQVQPGEVQHQQQADGSQKPEWVVLAR